MVNINFAYTEKINPSGVSPVLTRDQIWKGLQRKIRRAQDFVPVIERTDVLEDNGDVVVRVAHFSANPDTPVQSVKEVCKSYYPAKVDFHQPDGSVVSNTISDGDSLTEHDYHMTYTFEWRYPDVAEGSDEHKKLVQSTLALCKRTVQMSITQLRKLATQGELD